jgi:hypothetical protein
MDSKGLSSAWTTHTINISQGPRPDLTATINNLGNNFVPGAAVSLSGTVRNFPPAAAPVTVNSTARYQISTNNGPWTDISSHRVSASPTTPLQVNTGSGAIPSSWIATIGSHRIRLCADVNNVVPEVNEGDANNCAITTAFTVTGRPDLTAVLNAFADITVGSRVTFGGTVSNIGSATASGESVIGFAIDINNDGDIEDVGVDVQNLGSPNYSFLNIPINFTSQTRTSNSWTSVLGTHTVYFCADAASQIIELDEYNNCATREFYVAGLPNLVPTIVGPTGSVNPGAVITFQGRIRNEGTGFAAPSTARFQIDKNRDNDFTDANEAQGDYRYDSNLAANSGTGAYFSATGWTAPATPGTYNARLCADVNGEVTETDENNCTPTFAITVVPVITTKPDLTATLDNLPSSIAADTPITLHGRVHNSNVLDVTQQSNAHFQVKSTSAITWTNVGGVVLTPALLRNTGSGPLPSVSATPVTWQTPNPGIYEIRFCADEPNGVIDESIETNNCSDAGGVATTIAVGKPDLTAVLEDPSATHTVNTPLTLSGRVQNFAPATAFALPSNAQFQVRLGTSGNWINVGGLVPTARLNVGEGTGIITAPASNPSRWTPTTIGSYQLRFCADVGNAVLEVNEGEANNCSPASTVVVNNGGVGGNLALSCVPVPGSIVEGSSVTWRATPTGGSGLYGFIWGSDSACTNSFTSTKQCNTYTEGSHDMSVTVYSGTESAYADCDSLVVARGGGTGGSTSITCTGTPVVNPIDSNYSIHWSATATPPPATRRAYNWTIGGTTYANRGSVFITNGYNTSGQVVNASVTIDGTSVTNSCPAVTIPTMPTGVNTCGNGTRDPSEACDDGARNGQSGSFCTVNTCKVRRCNYDNICQPLRGEIPGICTDCKADEGER